MFRSTPPGAFLGKGVLKICSKFTGEHPCRKVILIMLQSNFIEITFSAHFFFQNTSEGLLLSVWKTLMEVIFWSSFIAATKIVRARHPFTLTFLKKCLILKYFHICLTKNDVRFDYLLLNCVWYGLRFVSLVKFWQ